MDEVIQEIQGIKDIVFGGDMNGYVEGNIINYEM